MTIEEVVRKVLLDEHADVIREAVKAVAAELMEREVSELIRAGHPWLGMSGLRPGTERRRTPPISASSRGFALAAPARGA